jgi:hypothetical protein
MRAFSEILTISSHVVRASALHVNYSHARSCSCSSSAAADTAVVEGGGGGGDMHIANVDDQ